jgi:DNA-binding FadR family transcriptional regulator
MNINEHKAPTDESIRLLNEFQEKAKHNIIYQQAVTSNNFTFHVTIFRHHFNETLDVWVKFNINGSDYELRFPFNLRDVMSDAIRIESHYHPISQIIDKMLRQKIAEIISEHIEIPELPK